MERLRAPCERLNKLMERLRGGGIFRISGQVNDKFFTSQLKISSIEEVIAEILKRLNYRIVLFYSLQGGLYTINDNNFIENLKKIGLAGKVESVHGSFAYLSNRIDKISAVQYIEGVLTEDKATVVLPYATAVEVVTDNPDFFGEYFNRWNRNLGVHRNSALVIIEESDRRREDFAIGKENCTDVSIPLPLRDEIRRLVHYYRLVKGLKLRWEEEEEIIKALVRSKESLFSLFKVFNSINEEICMGSIGKNRVKNPWEELESLIGLNEVKEEIRKYIKQFKKGELSRPHLVFVGNPGVGKTTVARILAEILAEEGCLPKGHLVECSRQDLVGQYVGETSQKVKRKVEEALGGVLFIDEAYAIDQGDHRGRGDFGKEAIDTLTPLLENHKDELVVIFAGYRTEMFRFLSRNEGLKSRVPTVINFPDYNAEELEKLFYLKLKKLKGKYKVSEELKAILKHIFSIMEKQTIEGTAGVYINARGVENLLDFLVRNAHGEESTLLTPDHLPGEWKFLSKGVDENLLNQVQRKLEELEGLHDLKRFLKEFIHLRKIQYKEFKEGKRKTIEKPRSLHFLFKGNPGTGKTTAAKLMGMTLKALNLLPNDLVIVKTPGDILDSGVGESEKNLKELIESAKGCVLFIDEAGPLISHDGVFKTLIAEMEKRRDTFSLILAGYPHEIERIKEKDPGIESRICAEIEFEDFSDRELWNIFVRKLEEKYLTVEEENMHELKEIFEKGVNSLRSKKGIRFGNAREIEKLADKVEMKRASRLSELGGSEKVIAEDLGKAFEEILED